MTSNSKTCYHSLMFNWTGKKVTFGIFEFRIHINACVAHSTIQSIHNHGQFNCPQRAWHSTDKYGFPGIQWMRVIHHKIWVIQVPRPDLNLDFRRKKNTMLTCLLLIRNIIYGLCICQFECRVLNGVTMVISYFGWWTTWDARSYVVLNVLSCFRNVLKTF